MARNVTDCAYFLSVLAGYDHHSPISIEQPGAPFAQPLGNRSFKGVRVAMFKDMGLPWEPEVKSAVQAQRKVFESLGCIVEDAEPDFAGANESFLAWRHWSTELAFGDLLATHGDQLNEYIHWHVEEGRKLTGPQLSRIEARRTALYQRLCNFEGKYEFFVLPVNQVLPFAVDTHYPTEIAGVQDGKLYCLDEVGLLHFGGRKPGDVSSLRFLFDWASRSACRSLAAITTTGVCCSWGTRLNRPLTSASAGRLWSR